MSAPKVQPADSIDFRIATPKACSGTAAARGHPAGDDPPARDPFTRRRRRLDPDPDTLSAEARTQVAPTAGVLVAGDTTLDTPYARSIAPVPRHWSGKHHAVGRGRHLGSVVWTDGDRHVPCDSRVYETADGRTGNDHLGDMVRVAYARRLEPRGVGVDGWDGRPDNLKVIRAMGWTWWTRLKWNRRVNLARQGPRPLRDTRVAATGTGVWLPGSGVVRGFGMVAPHGGTTSWATHHLGMTDLTRWQCADSSWAVEHDHRGIKQGTGGERCPCRSARAERHHIGQAVRACLRVEAHCRARRVSGVEAKTAILRDAVRPYLAEPHIQFPTTATA